MLRRLIGGADGCGKIAKDGLFARQPNARARQFHPSDWRAGVWQRLIAAYGGSIPAPPAYGMMSV